MLLWQMPITIKNKALEERIRALAKRTGETPSAMIARLAREDLERLEAETPQSQAGCRDESIKGDATEAQRRGWARDKPSCG